MGGKTDGVGPLQNVEEKPQGDLSSVYKYSEGECLKVEDSTQCCPVTGQEATDTN